MGTLQASVRRSFKLEREQSMSPYFPHILRATAPARYEACPTNP
jgi:hypothetical protein